MRSRPHADWLVLGWLVRRLLNEPEFRVDAAGRASGVDALRDAADDTAMVGRRADVVPTDPDELFSAVLASEQVSALACTGTSMTANVTEYLLWALHVATDSMTGRSRRRSTPANSNTVQLSYIRVVWRCAARKVGGSLPRTGGSLTSSRWEC